MSYVDGVNQRDAIAKVRYTHDAMIDMIITEPGVHQNELAERFGYTPAWVSQVISSDAFQARLEERKEELVDPIIVASIKDRLQGVASMSLQKLSERLETGIGTGDLLKAVEISTKALGYGARAAGVNVNVQQNSFVVALPGKAVDAKEWAAEHKPAGVGVVEATVIEHQAAPVLEKIEKGPEMVRAVGSEELFEVTRL